MLHEVRDEGDGLDGFPQTHLIREDPIQVVVVERNQPLQTFNLTDTEGQSGETLTSPKRKHYLSHG